MTPCGIVLMIPDDHIKQLRPLGPSRQRPQCRSLDLGRLRRNAGRKNWYPCACLLSKVSASQWERRALTLIGDLLSWTAGRLARY